jgi:hypothetical protein
MRDNPSLYLLSRAAQSSYDAGSSAGLLGTAFVRLLKVDRTFSSSMINVSKQRSEGMRKVNCLLAVIVAVMLLSAAPVFAGGPNGPNGDGDGNPVLHYYNWFWNWLWGGKHDNDASEYQYQAGNVNGPTPPPDNESGYRYNWKYSMKNKYEWQKEPGDCDGTPDQDRLRLKDGTCHE